MHSMAPAIFFSHGPRPSVPAWRPFRRAVPYGTGAFLLCSTGAGFALLQERLPGVTGQRLAILAHGPGFAIAGGRLCGFGATVDLEDQDTGNSVTYQIVGEDEADIKVGKVSVSSPMARALIGKYAGDIAQVQAPGGIREYEIIDIRYE